MKKALRIIIPILLALAILFCIVWYLFIYDKAFTRDLLLYQARLFEKNGNTAVAAWFYDCAYKQSGDSDEVAIELAEQYRAIGNYTKAELTLSSAIADGGGVDLYVALSKTYVEQGKLLDAVKMLDNVVDPDIKSQLAQIRPAAPTATPESGFYNKYISVTVQAESGTLYVSADGQYPSIKEDAYTQPIALKEGENTLYALAVDDKGLVSPLAIFGYTIGGVIEEVKFSDPAMEAAIRTALNASESAALLTSDLWTIKTFTVPTEAAAYDDLKHLTFLEELTINSGVSGQLHNISSMASLKKLTITKTPISPGEVAVIGNLTSLESLTLSSCGLSSTVGLENAKNIVYLDLSNNTIRNITGLSTMTGLQHVYMQHNALTDLSALAGATGMIELDVSYNSLSSLAPVSGMTALKKLEAGTNSITDLTGIDKLTSLMYLSVAYNTISSVSKLNGCTALTELNISNNVLTSISELSALTQLQRLNFSYNEVSELPDWNKNCALVTIDGSHNKLSSIDALGGMENLNNVYMDYNEELSSISALADCHRLVLVNVYGTKVSKVNALTEKSVIVNFNPTQG